MKRSVFTSMMIAFFMVLMMIPSGSAQDYSKLLEKLDLLDKRLDEIQGVGNIEIETIEISESDPPEAVTDEGSKEKQVEKTGTSGELVTGAFSGRENPIEGITFETAYTGEILSNVSGGINRKTGYLDNLDLVLSLDAEELFGWRGATISLYALANNGYNPTDYNGDAQGTSNIEADDTWKLYEAWIDQSLADGRLSILAGLYDLNSEFDVQEVSGLFTNSSHGIGPEFSQSGQNGPSIFPSTSLGLRVKIQPNNAFYIQSVVLDGVPGNPDNPVGTQIILRKEDGVLIGAEAAYLIGVGEESDAPYGKFGIGGWLYTSEFDDLLEVDNAGEPVKRSGNSGFYVFAEQTVYRESGDPGQGLAFFARFGVADERMNQFGSYFGAGLVATGPFPGRDEDQIGFALASAQNGDNFKKAQENAGASVDDSELTLEFIYRAQLTPWLAIQPDMQYVINPCVDPEADNAFIIGTRFEVSF